ncbi:MAG: 50S ribosomal protein L6 [Clostridia bacterium]|nr:50S ribosomal protein L6 [Clostridia bacterium]
MSRIGNKPIAIPDGVEIKIDGNKINVKGKNGELNREINPQIVAEIKDKELIVSKAKQTKETEALHGLTRTLIANMVEGVSQGFKKQLEINGVGYTAAKQGKTLVLNIGYSHKVNFDEPDGIKIEVPSANTIIISGADKRLVGQLAADIRAKRPPEPYKGKGIKYVDEHIRRKEGKAGKVSG